MARSSSSVMMVSEPVGSVLLRLSIPMMWGLLAVMSTGLVDAYFVGFLGVEQLAALAFCFPAVFVLLSTSFGIGVGVTSVVARLIGKSQEQRAAEVATNSMLLMGSISVVMSVIGYLTIDTIFGALGASGDLLGYVREYMEVIYLGIPFLNVAIIGNNISRALGDSTSPSRQMVLATVINIALTPVLVFGFLGLPAMGVAGAAWASAISFIFSFVHALACAAGKGMLVRVSPSPLRIIASCRSALYIGVPAAFSFVLAPVGTALLLGIVAPLGADAVAAVGVGTRLEPIAALGTIAISIVIPPFVGQNCGAGQVERVRQGAVWGMWFCVVWGAVVAALLLVVGNQIAAAFGNSAQVEGYLLAYLYIVPISFIFLGICSVCAALCNALSRPIDAVGITLLRVFVLILPAAWLAAREYGTTGVFIAIAAANVVSGLVVLWWTFRNILPLAEEKPQ